VISMRKRSLRFKLYALVIMLLLVMGVSIVVTAQLSLATMEQRITSETRSTVRALAIDRLTATAGKYGELVSGMFSTAYRTPEVVRNVVTRNIRTDSSGRISRVALQETVGAVLEEQKSLSSIYAQFEPDAYDGQDRYFTGGVEDHSSDEGTLEIYYYRSSDGEVVFSRTEDPATKYLDQRGEFGIREAEWYLCSMDTKKPCIMEPYDYQIEEGYSELMTSLVLPILKGGEFAGVVGVDINLSTLQKTIEKVSQELYSGESRVTLLSNQGLIAASSHYSEFLGRPLAEALPERAENFATLHRDEGTYDDGETLAVSYPIGITLANTEWSLLIELPREAALADVAEITSLLSAEVNATALKQALVGVLVSVIAIGLLVVLVRSMTRPLNEIRDRMKNLASAEGDLTSELKIDTHAELIDLARGFNQFMSRLRNMISDLKGVNAKVGQQAMDVNAIARDTNEQTESQHRDIESVVTAMNEMSAAAGEVAGFAGEAAENAQMAQDGIRFTKDTLALAVNGVSALASDMDEASTAIGQVATRSEDINRIIEVIRGIAEQTNLLALNAAIEAARAGEQGRGFAVVADEVRTLASRTRESTDEISQMIDGLQNDVGGAVTVIKGGVDRATKAVEGTREADHSLASVVERISSIVEHVTHVATAAEQQSSVSDEINRNLTRINDAASDLRALAQRINASGQTLDEQVRALDSELSRLKT